MTMFDLETWKQRLRDRLPDWKGQMQAAGSHSLYGFLSALALWPLVEAARAGQVLPVAMALGSVAAGVGGNLLAEQVLKWKERSAGEVQDEIVAWTAEQGAQPEVRDALDAILLKLELVPQAQAALAEADRLWFQRELRGELARLGSQIQIDASGQAAVAVHGSAAAGAYGIAINGDVANSLVTVYVQHVPEAKPAEYQAALQSYLSHLLSTGHIMNLRGIRSFQPISIELEQAYVTLRALDPTRTEHLLAQHRGRKRSEALAKLIEQEHQQPLPLQRLLARHPRLVVLGDPGSGKTTFLGYLALSAARAIAADNLTLLADRLGFTGQAPLPILVPLREFGRYLRNLPPQKRMGPQPQLLLDYLNAYFAGWNLGLPVDFFNHHLDAGRCLVLLDGLDEVADFAERVLVSEQVEAFVQRYGDQGNRFVITCRIRGYEGQARLGQDFITCTVLPFNEDDIRRFAGAWCLAVATAQAQSSESSVRQTAQSKADDLVQTISASPKVRELASNPLLLTVIALVHQYRAKLPERRSELYNECTEVLLGYFELGKPGEESKRLARYTGTSLEMDAGEKRAFLEPIALAMHESHQREWERHRLVDLLAQQLCERGQTKEAAQAMALAFLEALTVRSGLIQEVEQDAFGFVHLSFQEYLTARKLADSLDYIAASLAHLGDSWWEEVLLLEAGHLSEGGRSRASLLVEAILTATGDPLDRLLFAGACLADVGQAKTEADLWRRVVDGLLAALTGPAPATRRAAAGRVLARLGDPRPGIGLAPNGLPDLAWSDVIESGPFPMGNETPPYHCTLIRQPYRIGRYPITVAQYRAFVAAKGYEQRQYWTQAGWKWRMDSNITGTRDFGDPFALDNHPQVGMSWYEAVAFCRWLSAQTGLEISLPTEAQWERAARHTDARLYPWGEGDPAQRCNIRETGIGSTCAAGLFGNGHTVCGAADMSGNVWEWCSSKWRDNYDSYEKKVDDDLEGNADRVLRGGSWLNLPDFASALARSGWFNPNLRDYFLGFRVVVRSSSL